MLGRILSIFGVDVVGGFCLAGGFFLMCFGLGFGLGFSCGFVGLVAYLWCWLFLYYFRVGYLPAALASPCILIGLFASPLCGAALTFFAAAKKVSKESGSPRQPVGVSSHSFVSGPRRDRLSRRPPT
jgi:hypothetical protein